MQRSWGRSAPRGCGGPQGGQSGWLGGHEAGRDDGADHTGPDGPLCVQF